MQRVMMVTTERHGELIAHLAPERGRLSKFEMVGIARGSLTDQARLPGDECEMGLTSSADRLAYGRDHFRRRRLMVACRTVDVRIRGTVRSWFQRRTWNVVRLASVVGGVELSEVGGLHGAGVVSCERVLCRQSSMCSATIWMGTRIASSVDVPRRGCHCLARMFPVISSECSQKIQLVDPLGASIVEVTGCEA
jgi:hypothetical protein